MEGRNIFCFRVVSFFFRLFTPIRQMGPHTIWGGFQLSTLFLYIFRVILHIHPALDHEWIIPGLPRHILIVIPSEITMIFIMTFVSIICAKSLLIQLSSKARDQDFRSLCYESIFGEESRLRKLHFIPLAIVIFFPISTWYLGLWFIASTTTGIFEFIPFLHPLQIYPLVIVVLQSLFQGVFLVWTFSLPSFAETLRRRINFHTEIQEHIHTNWILLINCICLMVLVNSSSEGHTDYGLYKLAIGEILYRFLSVIILSTLIYPPHCLKFPVLQTDNAAADNSSEKQGSHGT